jgi:hypothetical protein
VSAVIRREVEELGRRGWGRRSKGCPVCDPVAVVVCVQMVAQEGAPADIERILSRLEEEEALVLELRLGLRGQAVHNVKQVRPHGPRKHSGRQQAPSGRSGGHELF